MMNRFDINMVRKALMSSLYADVELICCAKPSDQGLAKRTLTQILVKQHTICPLITFDVTVNPPDKHT